MNEWSLANKEEKSSEVLYTKKPGILLKGV